MWRRLISADAVVSLRRLARPQWQARRGLITLAIETSCDDTSVAILEKNDRLGRTLAQLHFHKKVTSDNAEYRGVHPIRSLISHQENLARLVSEAIRHLPARDPGCTTDHGAFREHNSSGAVDISMKRLPDFVSVTRGPGMRSNLFHGLDVAKGLAAAWQKPLVGVHHMQAHALTPRLMSALEQAATAPLKPGFPFLSVLASGGHTLLIQSESLTEHRVLGTTNDIAVGECLDKIARLVLPQELLQSSKNTMYGALLEQFAFRQPGHKTERDDAPGNGSIVSASSQPVATSSGLGCSAEQILEKSFHHYQWYEVPSNHEEALRKNITKWGWSFNQPLTKSNGGTKINTVELSFSGLLTAVERAIRYHTDTSTMKLTKIERNIDEISLEEKRDIAREAMRAAFEHVTNRVILSLRASREGTAILPGVVIAGGVAANRFLRHILASTLCARGYSDVKLYFPPPAFCTDNAAMIAWAGLEMFEAGCMDPLSIRAIRKWPLDRLLNPVVDG
ncbi:glycoprotease family-domain-containing protein [Paraphoma chrysanthemicola]|uniref:Glycoprotease family-domain-containing protein n=1 Tax=Paraphoma chrysanthemicola TaxID=798071 RepID=A0A8K0R0H6_9PLEO|nr:glycoprotease family-domain-containing protein [Paraphoma chrysanthemicola]